MLDSRAWYMQKADADERGLPAQVIMAVPHAACILVDYERGLTIPNLPWPRLRRGLHQRSDHPWDVLQVCAPTIKGVDYDVLQSPC